MRGEWEYLLGFRDAESCPPPRDWAVARALQRLLLVVEDATGQWRLRVPLMRRWCASGRLRDGS